MLKDKWFPKKKVVDGVMPYGNMITGLANWRKHRIKLWGWRDELGMLWSDELHFIWMVDPKDKCCL